MLSQTFGVLCVFLPCREPSEIGRLFVFILRKGVSRLSNGKFDKWKSPRGLKKIAEMYASGMSYQSIANKIGCDRKTLNNWINNSAKFPTMKDELQEAAIDACKPLEDAAWKAAKGFEYEERTYRPNADGEMELVEKKIKYAAPQPMLLQFLLKNKKPNEYKDKQEIEADTTVTIRFEGGSGGADWDAISG